MNILLCLILVLKIDQIRCFKPPNLVLILADDLGYNDVGFRGNNQVKTPNIDALAYNGVILDNFYTLPICTPSRAALMTGNYPIKSGFQGFPMMAGEERHLPFNMPTLPEQLQKLGYHTNLVGKWHLGYAYRNVTPISRGFNTHYGYYNGYIGYFNHKIREKEMDGLDFRDNFEVNHQDDDFYATDLFTKRSIKIINDHNYEKNPLFLMISHLAPHTGKTLSPGVTILEEKNTEEMNENFGYIKDINRRKYVDVVKSLDDSVGLVMEALSNRGVLDDTFILFMSDNGGITTGLHSNFASNWPLKGLKNSNYQGGIKGTAIFYSKHLTYKRKNNYNLMHITDLLPTFYAAGGGDTKDLGEIDGKNQLLTLLFNKPTTRKEVLINIDEVLNGSGIISHGGRFKLVQGVMMNGNFDDYHGVSGRLKEDGFYDVESILNSPTNLVLNKKEFTLKPEDVLQIRKITSTKNCRGFSNYNITCDLCLFDLYKDPCERINLSETNKNLVNELKGRIDFFNRQLIPQQNKGIDPRANPELFNSTWSYWLN
nr:arylsulfatase B-like isoform X1 [Onthophagus taurus]